MIILILNVTRLIPGFIFIILSHGHIDFSFIMYQSIFLTSIISFLLFQKLNFEFSYNLAAIIFYYINNILRNKKFIMNTQIIRYIMAYSYLSFTKNECTICFKNNFF